MEIHDDDNDVVRFIMGITGEVADRGQAKDVNSVSALQTACRHSYVSQFCPGPLCCIVP